MLYLQIHAWATQLFAKISVEISLAANHEPHVKHVYVCVCVPERKLKLVCVCAVSPVVVVLMLQCVFKM